MGNYLPGKKNQNFHKLLYKALLNNRKKEVSDILTSNPQLINEIINPENNMTPIQVAAYYNAFDCTNILLGYNPELAVKQGDKDAYFLAAERDNIYVLKDLWEHKPRAKDIEYFEYKKKEEDSEKSNNNQKDDKEDSKKDELNMKEKQNQINFNSSHDNNKDNSKVDCNSKISNESGEINNNQNKDAGIVVLGVEFTTLDWAILNMCYRCAFYLHCEVGIPINNVEFYLDNRNKNFTSKFNFPLFIDCLEKRVPRGETPSFYLSTKQKKDLETHLPDPDETWSSFYRRMINFELYKPPLVHKDSIPIEKKNTLYMKMQTKLLEIEYNKKCKIIFKFYLIIK